ncbi:ATP-binding protein [Tellurirhabdus bombi]|uniref:ATP-binding protein n=1 Tax=Tellurirhabdus bombi TaxID=2907205 RepID=UPI001F380A1F|nr:ATP-binding protein [Tellurirhabdus bombi]
MNTPFAENLDPSNDSLALELLNSLPDAIAWLIPVWDEQQRLIDFQFGYANQEAEKIIGLSFQVKTGKYLLADNTENATLARLIFDQYEEVFLTEKSKEYSYISPITGAHLYVVRRKWRKGVLSITRDRTVEQKMEQEREHEAEKLKFVTDSALTAIALYKIIRDPETQEVVDLRYDLINHMAERMTGRPASELIGNTMQEVFPGIKLSGIWKLYKELAETGVPLRYHNHYTHEGYNLWYEVQGVRSGDFIVLSFLDITELKQSQEEKQKQADLLNSILTASPVAFVQYQAIRDEQGQIINFQLLLANEAAANAKGHSISDLIGKTALEVSPNISQVFDHYKHVTETGEPLQFERVIGERWFQTSLVKFGDGLISTYLDVTQSHEYRQQLEATNQELLRSNSNLAQFAYVASHDLQEPLRKIQAFGTLLTEQYASILDEDGQDYIERMQAAASRMSSLIRDLLAYSRVTTIQQKTFKPVFLNHVIKEVLDDLDISIRETGAFIQIDQLPTLNGDPLQFRQLFQNLIGNALKFRQLTLSPIIQIGQRKANKSDLPDILLATNQPFLEIWVRDNGIGFDAQYKERIFQVFQRLHTKQQYAGTGVGLSICKQVTENHGGSLTAISKLGQGAEFKIFLPESLLIQSGSEEQ